MIDARETLLLVARKRSVSTAESPDTGKTTAGDLVVAKKAKARDSRCERGGRKGIVKLLIQPWTHRKKPK